MNAELQAISEFMKKMRFDHPTPLVEESMSDSARLSFSGDMLQRVSTHFENVMKERPVDERSRRAHLMVEELSEVLFALSNCDEEALLDGLADLTYVVLGTAVQYDLPLQEAFDEVQASNMTKRRLEGDARIRDKGPDYRKADVGAILRLHRNRRKFGCSAPCSECVSYGKEDRHCVR